jgi:hypothetical protein
MRLSATTLLGGVAHQRGDPQPELQRGVFAAQLRTEPLQPVDALADVVERLAPKELDVGLGFHKTSSRGGDECAPKRSTQREAGAVSRSRSLLNAGLLLTRQIFEST